MGGREYVKREIRPAIAISTKTGRVSNRRYDETGSDLFFLPSQCSQTTTRFIQVQSVLFFTNVVTMF